MTDDSDLLARCPRHGKPRHRGRCRHCNAAYMRGYLHQRRRELPARSLWERAQKRAKDRGLPFTITKNSIKVPSNCPVLGLPVRFSGRRSASSPSLDRILPERGYVQGNVRVISDRANRLKGNRSLEELLDLAERGPPELRPDYRKVAAYMQREELLREVRAKARRPGREGREWEKIAEFLDRVFNRTVH